MSNNILNYFGLTHTAYLHASGRLATQQCIAWLDLKPHERVLDVGFGTGVTLVQIAASCKDVQCFGVDVSGVMHQKATERVRFCGLAKQIELHLLQKKNVFPFASNSFDKIYAESIIAIQEGNDFTALLSEIHRVLKPGGIFIMNETIWKESVPIEKAKAVNHTTKELYGIIQANHEWPTIHDWKRIFRESGFKYSDEINLARLKPLAPAKKGKSNYLSELFTLMGKCKSYLVPSLLIERMRFKKSFQITADSVNQLESYIIKWTRD